MAPVDGVGVPLLAQSLDVKAGLAPAKPKRESQTEKAMIVVARKQMSEK